MVFCARNWNVCAAGSQTSTLIAKITDSISASELIPGLAAGAAGEIGDGGEEFLRFDRFGEVDLITGEHER